MTASTELSAVRCSQCGGTVRIVPGARMATCLFCDAPAAALVPTVEPEGIEPPIGAIPFAVDEGAARAAFVKFAGSSFWYPNDLRSASLELRRLLLPAWAWSGDVETHWTGLVSAGTRSGKRPVAGAESTHFDQILVPASRTLRRSELTALGRYDESTLGGFDPDRSEVPIELSETTRSAARTEAHAEMLVRHRAAIQGQHTLTTIRASSLATALDGKPVLVPVYIGAYRYGDRTFRVLVNGQTGRLVGDAPFSWWKVAAIALAVVAVLTAVALCVGGGSTIAAILAAITGSR
ncbi:MAG: hypothetical protein ABMB14_09860 [Myxococcota bacterium]